MSRPTTPPGEPRPAPRLPARVDSVAFARARQSLAGVCPIADLPRLLAAGADPVGELQWEVSGSPGRDDQSRLREYLDVHLRFAPTMACGRCLGPVLCEPLQVATRYRLAASERQAEIEDQAENAIDVVAHHHAFDLAALVEDEAILALPMFVAHDRCPDGETAQGDV